ncbi:hypothetical protein D3C79_855800 [compost metagenome]
MLQAFQRALFECQRLPYRQSQHETRQLTAHTIWQDSAPLSAQVVRVHCAVELQIVWRQAAREQTLCLPGVLLTVHLLPVHALARRDPVDSPSPASLPGVAQRTRRDYTKR